MWGRYPICILDRESNRAEQLRVILEFLGEQCKVVDQTNYRYQRIGQKKRLLAH